MAISKYYLDKITAAPSPVESFKAVLDALVDDQTIKAEVAGIVKLALDHRKDDLNPAIVANNSN